MENNNLPEKCICEYLNNDFRKKYIKRIENNSDSYLARMRIIFQNNYELSIIRGEFSYGGNQGLFEIALTDSKGNFLGQEKLNFQGDDVKGYLTEQEVFSYVKRIAEFEKI